MNRSDVLLTECMRLGMNVRGDVPVDQIETILETATIPVRIACMTPGEKLWMLSLWFLYRDGKLHCATSKQADVIRYLTANEHVAFEISTNDPPYSGVRGNGETSIADDPNKELLRTLLERYLGSTKTPLARRLLSDDREEVTISIEPSVVFGWDYSDRMSGTSD